MKTRLCWSPSAGSSLWIGSRSFSTASDSPVRTDSCTRKLALSIRLPSAGMEFPASNRMISPGTSSREEISLTCPPRRTRTLGVDIFFRAAIACSARYSWLKPSAEFKITMIRITIASLYSCRKSMITAAMIRISTIVSLSCSKMIFHGLLVPRSISSFAPYFCWRMVTSFVARPLSRLLSSSFRISCGCLANQFFIQHPFPLPVIFYRWLKKKTSTNKCWSRKRLIRIGHREHFPPS